MFNTNIKTKIKYFAYVRKSTEGEERQALSIDSQKDKAKEFFKSLDVVEILEERHSAFSPCSRPVFEEMIRRIKRGEAQGIIAWHPDRLSRNEIDASTITYLVRTGVIADLKFGSYNFDNSPEGIMMLQLALSQSQYFSSKLSKDVKRGIEKKFDMGWHANLASEGYLNKIDDDKGMRRIIVDKKRFPLMRKAFDLMLTGNYTPPQVLKKLNDEWGYRRYKRRKTGGKPLSKSAFYRILNNPFYAGIIRYNGKEKIGKHKAMITLEEYDRIQVFLGRNGNPRAKTREFAFTGAIKCDECGCQVTAEAKRKYIKSENKVKNYTYYHCTHKRKDYKCKQKSVEEQDLKNQIDNKLKTFALNPKFKDLAFYIIDDLAENAESTDTKINENVIKTIDKTKQELKNLNRMRVKEFIDDDEYLEQRNELKREINKLEQNVDKKEEANNNWVIPTKEIFELATHGRLKLKQGTKEEQKAVLNKLGSNQALKDGILNIERAKWILPIENSRDKINSINPRLEPPESTINKAQNKAFNLACATLRRERDSNPRRAFTLTSLAGTRFQPLSHLSIINFQLSIFLSVFYLCIIIEIYLTK